MNKQRSRKRGGGSYRINLNIRRSSRKRKLYVGVKVPCLFYDEKYRICEIMQEKVIVDEAGKEKFMYYVHYDNYDKRMDRWVFEDSFDLAQIGTKKTDNELQGVKTNLPSPDRKVTRAMKRKHDFSSQNEIHDPELARLEKRHSEITKVKNIDVIRFENWDIGVWYYSPYPEEIIPRGTYKAFICRYCLKYFCQHAMYEKHEKKVCKIRQPPGRVIYRDGNYGFWEIDGEDQKFFCQNLCLLAKLFLDHKTLYYDVESFIFYVITHHDHEGHHIMGYFSKEKRSGLGYNLACIMILPPYQRKGWGKYLIHFSYQLSRLEGEKGTPEIPLSDLGRVSYHSYWRYVCLKMLEKRPNLQVGELSTLTSIKEEDIIVALQDLNLVKYWKKENVITANTKLVKEHLEGKRAIREIHLEKIVWFRVKKDEETEDDEKKKSMK